MKILLIYHHNGLGGGVRSGLDIALALSSAHDVKILIPSPRPELKQVIEDEKRVVYQEGLNVPCFSYYNGGASFFKASIFFFLKRKNFRQWNILVAGEKPDLILYNSIVQWPLFHYLRKLNIPSICFVRETMKGQPFFPINIFIRKRLEQIQGVAFLTSYDKSRWQKKDNFYDNWVVIPHMVDIDASNSKEYITKTEYNLSENDFIVLYLGGYSKIKGIFQLLKSAKYLKDLKIKILILGDCENPTLSNRYNFVELLRYIVHKTRFSKIKSKIDKLNRDVHRVIVKGMQNNIIEWYNIADVVVFPAQKVHQARPIYEAGLNRKTIIVPNYDNFNENLLDGYNGLYYKRRSSKDLGKKIIKLYKDRDYCNLLGENNYKMTIKNHDKNNINRKVLEFIEMVAKGE